MAKTNVEPKKYPKVIVLILSYNGKHLLEEAVSSYLANDYPNFRVIVIDNGSTDGTLQFVNGRFPGVEVLRTVKNLGYSGGLNLGLEYAFNGNCADYALVSNNDVRAGAEVISELVKLAETDVKIGFVTGKVYYYDRPNLLQTVGREEDPVWWGGPMLGNREKDTGQYESIEERAFIDDVYTLVSRKLYEDTGGYDTTFFLEAEEYDWQARAKGLGYRMMYTPYAKLWHKDSVTIGRDSPLKAYYDARNPMLVILLHRSSSFFRRYFWIHFRVRILRSSLVYLKHGMLSHAVAKWQGWFSALKWGFRNRKFTPRHFI